MEWLEVWFLVAQACMYSFQSRRPVNVANKTVERRGEFSLSGLCSVRSVLPRLERLGPGRRFLAANPGVIFYVCPVDSLKPETLLLYCF